ncbi:MAG: LysR substrate-binding domain-containing protein [Burkholderiales bacterium]
MWRLPNFHLLRAFEAAGRLRSFRLAARELSVTPSAISHQIKDLEQFFHCTLFVRSPRRIELTAEGRNFYDRLAPVLASLQEICDATAGQPTRNSLAIHCAPSLAVKWLGPRLPAFLADHPEITLRLSTGAEAPDLLGKEEPHVAILYGSGIAQPGIACESLGRERIAPLCSPALARRITDLRTQIDSLTLIESPLSPVKWADWCYWNGIAAKPAPRLSMDRAALAIASAVDDLGIALESTALAARELSQGELVELPCPEPKPIERDLHFLCCRERDLKQPAIATFREWLFATFHAHLAGVTRRPPQRAVPRRRAAAPPPGR